MWFARGPSYELPNSVLVSNCLKELSLTGCGIKKRGPIQLKSLTKLSLVEIMLSDKIMDEICEGCPMLEDLSLNGCCGLSKLKLTNPNIKRLNIFIGWRDEMANSSFHISCPSVKSLEISGSIQLARLKLSSSFSDAALCFSRNFKCERRIYGSIQMLLLKVAEANVFRPCTWTTLVLPISMSMHAFNLSFFIAILCLEGLCLIVILSHN